MAYRSDPRSGVAAAPHLTRERRPRARVFVGRTGELRALRAALDAARRGHGRLVLLTGEPGIGKTRIAEELSRIAARRGVEALWGRSHEGAHFPSYWPWIELLREWGALRRPRIAQATGARSLEIAELVPELGEALASPASPEALDGEEARFRLFDAVASFWRREASAQPLLLVLDDLHWADAASLRLLAFLSRNLRGARLLVVGTCRDAELHTNPAIASLLAGVDRETERIFLAGVGAEDVARLIEEVSGRSPPARLAEAIRARTDGNPLFVREIARALPGADLLDVDPERLPVPPAVNAVIERQADALEPAVRRLLATAAVIGREFELSLLASLEACTVVQLLPSLRAAARIGLLEPLAAPAASARFSHALVRETLYDGIDGPHRCALHLRVGEALEALHAGDLDGASDALAHHFLRAAPLAAPMRAVDYAERAGARAQAVFAFEDAARHFARALDALELGAPAPERRLALLLQLGEARVQAGSLALAAQTFAAAAALARTRGASRELARAALGFSRRRDSELGADPECIALLEEALAADGVPAELRALLLGRLASARYFAGDPAEATSIARQAVAEARSLGELETLALVQGALHWIMWTPVNAEQRLALSRDTLEQARLSGNRALYWRSVPGPLEDLLELGDLSGVDESLELYARGASETRQLWLQWNLEICRAMRAAMSGLFAEAEARSRSALELGRRINEEVAQQWFAIQLFFVRRDQGRLAELEAALRELAARQPQAPWRAGLARLLAEQGREPEARALLDELCAGGGERIRQDVNWPIRMSCMAEAAALTGATRVAAALYRAFLPFAGRHVIIGMRVGYDGPASRYLGLLARLLGLFDEAEQHLVSALGQTQKMGARPFEAYCHHDLARVLLLRGAAGDRESAAEHLARASELARALGMEGLRRRLAEVPASARRKVVALPSSARTNSGLFRREGEFWTVAYAGRVLRLRDNKGLQQIARLLREPGREFHVLDLLGNATGDGRDAPLEALDREARAAYARRLADLRDDLDEAERFDDPARATRAREEIDALTRELSRAVGLGGRDRPTASAAERARVNVSRTIHLALERIAAEHAALGRLLARTIKTGVFCSYVPDPERPIEWQ